MSASTRRGAATFWYLVVYLLVGTGGVESAGMLIGGNDAYAAPSYAVIRAWPGGVRLFGVVLASAVAICCYGLARRAGASGRDRFTTRGLALLAAWYAGWTTGIVYSFFLNGQLLSWSIVRTAAWALLLLLAARYDPTLPAIRRRAPTAPRPAERG